MKSFASTLIFLFPLTVFSQSVLIDTISLTVGPRMFLPDAKEESRLKGDVKVDFFQLLLGRIGGGVEFYHPSRSHGMYLSANFYTHIVYEIIENFSPIGGGGGPDTILSVNDYWSTWNVGFDYRLYQMSNKQRNRLLFLAPYIRFQQTKYRNSEGKSGSSEALALGLNIGRRKYFNSGNSFEWYLGGGYFIPISGDNAYINVDGFRWSLRHGLIVSFGY